MSNTGMDGFYKETFQDVPNSNSKELDLSTIYNKVITVDKNIDLITNIPDSYSMATIEAIVNYLETKYKKDKNIKIVTLPIKFWCKKYKSLNPSVGGERTNKVLESVSRLVDYIKNRTTVQRLTGENEKTDKK